MLSDHLLKESAPVVCDGTYGNARGAFGNVLRCIWTVKVNAYRVDVLKTTLDFLGNHGYGMLPATHVHLERFRGIERESLIAHELPCLRKKIPSDQQI